MNLTKYAYLSQCDEQNHVFQLYLLKSTKDSYNLTKPTTGLLSTLNKQNSQFQGQLDKPS